VSIAFALAEKLDRAGFRPAVAAGANLLYRGQHFSTDERGHWVNTQPECTIVSPSIHTARYAAFRDWVVDNWAYCYRPDPGAIILDIGSGVGEEAVVFSKMIGTEGRLIAVEAHPETFDCLSRTVERSGLGNVVPVHCAVADAEGEVQIGDGTAHLSNSILAGAGGGARMVRQRTIDSIASEYGLETIDYVRMNIEGAERLAVRGMAETVARVRHICISCHDFVAERTGNASFRSKAEVLPFLEQSGFTVTTRLAEPGKPWVGDYLYGSR
jgi:FkbM family methyltransferase